MRGAVGIVESAVLFGAPVTEDPEAWRAVRSVVAGRLVNVYSSNDWMLGVVYRASAMTTGAAGLRPIKCVGVENVDATLYVKGHTFYPKRLEDLFSLLASSRPRE